MLRFYREMIRYLYLSLLLSSLHGLPIQQFGVLENGNGIDWTSLRRKGKQAASEHHDWIASQPFEILRLRSDDIPLLHHIITTTSSKKKVGGIQYVSFSYVLSSTVRPYVRTVLVAINR